MAIWFVKNNAIVATPSDSNDGRDAIGFNLSGATYDDAGNAEGEHHLSSTGAFSGYTHNAGDLIYLSGGAGITTGLYEIASKVDDGAILLVNSAGSDSSSDVTSSDGPFATPSHAVNEGGGGNGSLAAGDEIRLCNDANHGVSATVTNDTVSGTSSNPIDFAGYDARGSTREQATIIASSSFSGDLYDADSVSLWRHFDLTFDANNNASSSACRMKNQDQMYVRCIAENAGFAGFQGGGGDGKGLYQFCIARNNSADGFTEAASSPSGDQLSCIAHDNGGDGFRGRDRHTTSNCVAYNNTGKGFYAFGTKTRYEQNTAYNNGGDGFDLLTEKLFCANNSSSQNGGYAFRFDESSGVFRGIDYNHTHSNTSGKTNLSGGLPGGNNITGDPLFADPANGDFTPQSGSALLNAGFDTTDL